MTLLVLLACRSSVEDPHAGMEMPSGSDPASMIVEVAPEVVDVLAIHTEPATSEAIGVSRRSPAMVSWDPHAVTRVTVQAGGQIRELLLPRPGESVEKGAVVARVYQPDVRAGFEELRVAAGLGEPWLQAARSRLVASGVTASDVARALTDNSVPETFAVRSPASGVVLEHPAKIGSWVPPGGVIGVLGDPSALVVDVIVSGVPPSPDTPVTLRDAASGAEWPARVASLLPSADAAGQTVRVIPSEPPPVGRPLLALWDDTGVIGTWIPRTALVDTGLRRVVFVQIAPGRYEPRSVEVGGMAGDRVQILSGVVAGESVVVSGAFLLDSETQIGTMGPGHGDM